LTVHLDVQAVCDLGRVRTNNEDMILVGNTLVRDTSLVQGFDLGGRENLCLAVADGMGGLDRGEEASQFVLERLATLVARLPHDLDEGELQEVFEVFADETHARIPSGSGSTLVGVLFYGDRAYRFHAGDSRLWRYRDGLLERLTKDHSLRERGNQPKAPSNILVNSFGGGSFCFVEFGPVDLRPGDRLLLSSDGLHDLINPGQIEALIREAPQDSPTRLLEAALAHGGKDNISILTALLGPGPTDPNSKEKPHG